jgi:hypothetical protein
MASREVELCFETAQSTPRLRALEGVSGVNLSRRLRDVGNKQGEEPGDGDRCQA